ncbi:hypothetical protein AAGS61_19580 [Lysinibacillus sp. KU-BSD001]|uniref:hypothetical protein n=1 Tax=Lysinibacillus sp. KU-BSD001 TaxID=3141328 RepID=UPI0036E656FF
MLKKLLWMIPLALILGISFSALDWPIWAALVVFALIASLEIPWMLYILYRSQNLKGITKYINQQRNNPMFNYLYQLREGSDAQITAALDRVLEKYNNQKLQAIYGANRAVFLKDFDAARRLIAPVAQTEIGQYTLALVAALENDETEMNNYTVQTPWMQSGLNAHLAFARGDRVTFERNMKQSINESKGIQYYSNIHMFERMKREI